MKQHVTWHVAVLGALALLLGAGGPARAAEEAYKPRPKGSLTFTRDVAPVVFKHCASCHRPGEVAPFALLTYRDVRKKAAQIRAVTEKRIMPPWKPVAGHGEFRGERRLTVDEIGVLKQWVSEGAPEGDAKHLPPLPKFPVGWQLGEPDLVVTLPKAYTVPAEGPDVYRNFVIPVKVPEGKFIRSVEFRPGNRRVVHHAIMSFDATGKQRLRDGKDGSPGFTQTNIAGQIFPGSIGFWVPGKEPRPLPEGVALAWPKGADLIIQVHYHPSGKAELDRSSLGIYFTAVPPKRALSGFVLQERKLDIPPGEKAYVTRVSKEVPADVDVYGIFPHMHLIGKNVKVTALLPDGTVKSLLRIDDWDFNWQGYYEYLKPVSLPKGTRLTMVCTHDNSADNPSNPNQPPKRVVYGEQTNNEMAIVALHAMTKGPAGAVGDLLARARELVKQYDKDKDGKLSAEEIAAIPAAAGQDVKRVIQRFDRDGDGKLDAAEIAEVLRALRKR